MGVTQGPSRAVQCDQFRQEIQRIGMVAEQAIWQPGAKIHRLWALLEEFGRRIERLGRRGHHRRRIRRMRRRARRNPAGAEE
jgi:hypothetical protein